MKINISHEEFVVFVESDYGDEVEMPDELAEKVRRAETEFFNVQKELKHFFTERRFGEVVRGLKSANKELEARIEGGEVIFITKLKNGREVRKVLKQRDVVNYETIKRAWRDFCNYNRMLRLMNG
jgi:hypothetical protein